VNKIKLKQKLLTKTNLPYVPNKNVKNKSEKVLSATQNKFSTFLDVKFVDILRLANAMLASL